MKSSIALGIALLVLSLYLGAASEVQSADMNKTNATQPLNLTNRTENVTGATVSIGSTGAAEATNLPIGVINIIKPENASQTKAYQINDSAKSFELHPPKRDTYRISSTVIPITNSSNMDLPTLNSALLARIVDETPHGYLTYYN